MLEGARTSNQTVSRSAQLAKDGKSRIMLKEFSEEECVIVLADEEFEQPICQFDNTRQAVKVFKEYQGEDFSHYLPEPFDPIDPSARSKSRAGSKLIKRRRSSSAMPDIKCAVTSKPCRPLATPPLRPKHGLRHLLRHLANSLPPKKRTNKINSSSAGIHAFSFTDSKIGTPHATDSSDVLFLHTLEPDIRCAGGLLPVDNRMSGNESVTSRRSCHSNNFTLASRRSQSLSNVIDHVSGAALHATPTSQSNPRAPQATPKCKSKSTAHHATPTCQSKRPQLPGTQRNPDAVRTESEEMLSTEEESERGSSLWKKIFRTFQKGVDRQRRSCRRPLLTSDK